MGFWWVSGGSLMSFRGFLMSFWWVFDDLCEVLSFWWVVDEFLWFLMSFWWVSHELLMGFWWVFCELLGISYCFIMCQVIFLMSFWWVTVGSLMSVRGFLMSFWWVFDDLSEVLSFWWVSDEFFMISDEFRVFRFSIDSTKFQQNFNINHRSSTEKKSLRDM